MRALRRDMEGAVAAELAIAIPFLVLLVLGVIDFSAYMNESEAIAAATRVGAEYARDSTVCQSGVDVLANPQVSQACASGITAAAQGSFAYGNGLTVNAPTLACQCDDGTGIACGNNSCASAGRPAPNRVFITVSASEAITPIVSWPGFPTTLNGLTQLRIQ